jgi:hypothetical protein
MKGLLPVFMAMIFALAACKETDPVKVAPIPPAKMEKVLTDLHFAEIYSSMLSDSLHQVQAKNLDSLAQYYNEILKHHQLSVSQFEQGLTWYRENPEMLDSSYKHIISGLGEMETAGQLKKQP